MKTVIHNRLTSWLAMSVIALPSLLFASSKIKVVTSLPDLADIAQRIGGERVTVEALAKGYQDPHFVDAKPSTVLKLRDADIFVQVGLDLEIGWVPPLLETARNRKIYFGGEGHVDASQGIRLLQVPTGDPAQLRSQGDIHIYGNPHYWLDPINGKLIANNICARLVELSPDDQSSFTANLRTFEHQVDSAMAVWAGKLEPFRGTEIVAYHNSWPYFENRFGLRIADFVEPKPGIPPSPGHLVALINLMEERNIKVIIISPYFDDRPAKSLAERTGAEVVYVAPSVGAFKEVKSYFDLFDYNVNALLGAFKRQGVTGKNAG